MKFMKIILIALKNIISNRRRSLAILLTIACGTGALFLYHGFNTGIMNQYKFNTIRSRYGHGQINTHGYRDQVFEKPWEHWIQNYPTLKNYLQEQKEIHYIFPRLEFFALLTNGGINVSGRGQGIDAKAESEFFSALNIEEGKILESEEDGVLIGKGLAHSLSIKIGDRLTVLANTVNGTLNGIDLKVVGIFHTGTKEFDDVVFRLPLFKAQQLLDTTAVESVSLGLYHDDSWLAVKERVAKQFPNFDMTPFEILDQVYYQHAIDFLKAQFDTIKIIIIFIVILGIFNSVSTAIFERKQEIGNLRANGDSQLDVLILLILEGGMLGIAGSLVGIAAAFLLNNTILTHGILMPPSPGLTRQFYVFIELQPYYALIVLGLGILTAFIATSMAAIKIIRKPIGELLRSV